jgi:pyruvate dehydrogenase (quinone)
MQMLGMNALIDLAKYAGEWSDPRLVVVVLNNRDLNQVTWEQRAIQGDPMYPGTQSIPDFPYAKYAEMIGLKGVRVDDPDQVPDAWDEVLRADRPAVLEAVVDPEIPPLPPHITFEQAKHFAQATLHDPHAGRVVRNSVRQMFDSFLPGR